MKLDLGRGCLSFQDNVCTSIPFRRCFLNYKPFCLPFTVQREILAGSWFHWGWFNGLFYGSHSSKINPPYGAHYSHICCLVDGLLQYQIITIEMLNKWLNLKCQNTEEGWEIEVTVWPCGKSYGWRWVANKWGRPRSYQSWAGLIVIFLIWDRYRFYCPNPSSPEYMIYVYLLLKW